MKVVTVARLRKLMACDDQVELFRKTFGKSAKVTPANLTKAEKAGLNVGWLAICGGGGLYDQFVEAKQYVAKKTGAAHGKVAETCPICRPAARRVLLAAARG